MHPIHVLSKIHQQRRRQHSEPRSIKPGIIITNPPDVPTKKKIHLNGGRGP